MTARWSQTRASSPIRCEDRITVILVAVALSMRFFKKDASGEWVQGRQGLVEQQDLRSLRNRERQRCLRALAARQATCLAVQRYVCRQQPVPGQVVVPCRVHRRAELEQVGDGELLVERTVLGDEAHPG